MRLSRLCAFVAVICLSSFRLLGQTLPPQSADDQMGLLPYQSYHGGDFDHVGLASGMLNLDFPFLSYSQRGKLHLDFHLYYNNQPQHVGQLCANVPGSGQKCYNVWGASSTTGPLETGNVFVGWAQMQVLTAVSSQVVLNAGKSDQITKNYARWSVQTADGASHPLANLGTQSMVEGCSGCSNDFDSVGTGPWESLDATHWRVNGSLQAFGPISGLSIVDPDGVIGGTVDPNGNFITVSTNGVSSLPASFTDTLGRQIPAPPNAGAASNASTASCPAGPLPVKSAVSWTVPAPASGGGSATYIFCYVTVTINDGPGIPGVQTLSAAISSPTMLQSIVLPDGHSWGFQYNDPGDGSTNANGPINYGALTQITLPTGGTISYAYTSTGVTAPNCQNFGRWVASRTVNANDGTGAHTWTYAYGMNNGVGAIEVQAQVTDPSGNYSVHTFAPLGTSGCPAYESQAQDFNSAGTLLKTVNTSYSYTAGCPQCQVNGPFNVVPTQISTTWANGLTTVVNKSYDSGFTYSGFAAGMGLPGIYGKELSESESDYGNGSAGPVLKITNTGYRALADPNYLVANLLNLVSSEQVTDGSGNQLAYTSYGYDGLGLQPSNVSTQLGAAPNSVRGNLTSVSRWLNTTGGTVSSATQWYDSGEPYQQVDPLKNATTHAYSSNFAGAYPTQTCNALSQCAQGNYDFNTGLLTSYTDANQNTTTFNFDAMWRVTSIVSPPDVNGNHPQMSFSYSPAGVFPLTVLRQKTITPSLTDAVTTMIDGLGRVYETQHATPNGNATVVTAYDADGRKASVTNPYFSSSDPTYGVTQFQYDGLSRVTQTTKQDGSVSSVAYDVAAPAGIAADCTIATDEAGHSRRACSDGLGRLIEVDEPGDPIINFNGAAPPATAVYSMTGFPDSYGEHDLYVGTDQHIYQLLLTSSGWINQDLTAATNGELAASHSAMTSFTDSFGEHILYVGANQHIYSMFFNINVGWQNQDLTGETGNTLAALTTGLSSFADSNGEHVLYVGSNQHVNELLFVSGSGWTNQDLTALTGNTLAAAATGFTNFADSYGEHVFYEGANQHVYQLYFSGSWTDQDLTAQTGNTLAAVPTAFSSLIDSYGEHVFYFGSNQHLEQLYFVGGSGWQNQDLTGMTGNTLAVVGSSLSSFGDSMGEHAFYQGTNQHVYSMYFNGSAWSNQDLTAMTGSAAATGGGGLAGYSNGQGEYVFYDGGSQGVYELSWAAGSPWEATNIGGPSLAQNYYVTQYSYDALGNLLGVTQKGDPTVSNSSQYRVRTFSYDSLSRLLTATNPESGAISYSYDANGNVLQKTSPAPNQTGAATQTISYCYDALNRVTGKVYAAQSCPLSVPVVSYGYDAGANGIGHLTSLADQAGTGGYSYDALGRITSEQRTIANIQKNLRYAYNLDNSVATLTYPSGATVTYTPDSAGRMLSAVDSANNINYVTGASYGPDSSLTGFVSGSSSSFNGISNSWQYNQRLQICRITALTTGGSPTSCTDGAHTGNVLDLGYNLNLGNGDNGNVLGITNYKDNTRSQTFTYDALNRLTSAQNAGTNCNQTTAAGAGEYWGNSYGYDAWGNLLQKTVTKCSAESLSVTALANNQLSGYGYDAAGNMIHDAATGNNYNFDAENRITGAAGYSYTYDADGNRVEKSNGSTGTIYWYMSPGIVAESDLSGNLQHEYVFFNGRRVARKDLPGGAVSYYFSDSLQTASVITNSAGTITEDEDHYPWGGEIQFVNSDSNHYKFTGKERDPETGLDYFGARYYSNPLGRFITPDWAPTTPKPSAVPYADWIDPQSLNQYSYVRNVPTTKLDKDGHDPGDKFKTKTAAAADAVKYIRGKSDGYKNEYGTRIEKDGKSYSYKEPVTQGKPGGVDLQPLQKNDVGDVHTHNYGVDDAHANSIERPDKTGTIEDKDAVQKMQDNPGSTVDYQSFVGAPNGNLLQFTPNPNAPDLLGDTKVVQKNVAPDPNPPQPKPQPQPKTKQEDSQ